MRVELSSVKTSNQQLTNELNDVSRQLVLLNTELDQVSRQNTSMAHEV